MKALLQSGAGKQLMQRVRHLHFVGIGGAGMSGIAEVMLNLGYDVSGSDMNASAVTKRLSLQGAKVYLGHSEAHIKGVDVIIVSAAISEENPEIKAARKAGIPIVPRAEMLSELMRFKRGIAIAGTHGKTTTTSLTASVLAAGELDPTFVIGGLLNATGSHAALGGGDYLVAEADESDGSFLLLQPVMAVVTNIDTDHMDTYDQDTKKLDDAFVEFIHHLPFYGLAVMCLDDPGVQRVLPRLSRTVMTYGANEKADLRLLKRSQKGLKQTLDIQLPDGEVFTGCELNLPGLHNALNALAAIGIAWELGVPMAEMSEALSKFSGVGRRFSVNAPVSTGEGEAIFVEDYGHHPTEIAATLEAARSAWPERRIVLAFQPHRYSRTRDLFEDFTQVLASADALVLTEVYSAGENSINGADGRALTRSVRNRGLVEPMFVPDFRSLPSHLGDILREDDVLLLMGAGNIGTVAQHIKEKGLVDMEGLC